ncbi:MAG: signal peptidase I [Verrucomicrobia bacterium]|nr:signal peptidase I [Verrucomicrobiota bacterium]
MTIIRWFLSRAVRQATELRKHVLRLLQAQKDILSPEAGGAIGRAARELQTIVRSGADRKALDSGMSQLENVANKWLKPYPNPGIRENVEVLLVAVAVAISIRTFFLQPMKIPTGSMQPTLYGITHKNLKDEPGAKIPLGFQRWVDSWFRGASYYHYVARSDGDLRIIDESPKTILPFVTKQRFMVGDDLYTVWFPPEQFFERAGILEGQHFTNGEDIVKLKVVSGDHLFVDRFTYNFRRPRRGEIIIFETHGIEGIRQQDTFYIKRLIGLGGDHLRIGNDQHVIVNGRRLDASTPHFENLYTFGPTYMTNHYFGHVNGWVGARLGRAGIAPLFPDENTELVIRPDRYVVMGDNTMNSFDSRYWGDFPREKVIGKCGFVYWPILGATPGSSRFGWAIR